MNVRVCLTTTTVSIDTVVFVFLFFFYGQPHVTLIKILDFCAQKISREVFSGKNESEWMLMLDGLCVASSFPLGKKWIWAKSTIQLLRHACKRKLLQAHMF